MFNPDNLKNLLQQAQKVQADIQKAQETLKSKVFEGKAGPGEPWIYAKVDGTHRVIALEPQEVVITAIVNAAKEAAKSGSNQALVQMIKAFMEVTKEAVNQAVDGVENFTKGELGKLMQGVDLPSDLMGRS